MLSQQAGCGFVAGFVALALWFASPAGAEGPAPRGGASAPANDRDYERALRLYKEHTYVSPRAGAKALGYRLLPPETLKADRIAERAPLVVYLHGAGERGNDNARQLSSLPSLLARAELQRRFRCFVLAPQCPSDRHWGDGLDDLAGLIEKIRDADPIDARRIYLTGFSMGGYGAWALAAQRADLFAAVVPIAGGGDPRDVSQLVDLPVWAVHGDADRAVRCQESRQLIAAIQAAGGSPHYTELRGVDHDGAAMDVYSPNSEVLAWMFSQRKPWFSLSDWKTTTLAFIDMLVVLIVGAIWASKRRRRAVATAKLDSIAKGAE